ncbi:putative chromosome-partitioning protein ParB [mine drainage metagenome]|uniref:Putative chromosome-partitioning protein ParB n=1 Tax=mine drainage metagenome TaxID=410659 RepID=A0A1J5R3L0_9ZZZZ
MVKHKGLGRGLDALLAGDASDAQAGEMLRMLKVEQLQPGKYQPRTHMDQASLTALADSIRAQGVMQPILAREVGADHFEIIAGERRWRASKLAGLEEVPVLVRVIADEAALAMSLIENIQREDLNPLEEATGIKRLIDEFNMTHQSAAEAVGRSRTAVTNLLRLIHLAPPVQELLMQNRIDMGHARALLGLDGAMQIATAEQIAQKQHSVRETERMVQKLLRQKETVPARPDRDLLRLQELTAERIGAKVSISQGARGTGKMVIEYKSLDQLDGILGMLGVSSDGETS